VHRRRDRRGATGIDLSRELSGSTIARLRQVWLEHGAIFFRGQHRSPRELVRFARRFGEVAECPFIKSLPEVIPVAKLEHERASFGGLRHSATAHLEQPSMVTLLIAREDARKVYEAEHPAEGALREFRPHNPLRRRDRGGERPLLSIFHSGTRCDRNSPVTSPGSPVPTPIRIIAAARTFP